MIGTLFYMAVKLGPSSHKKDCRLRVLEKTVGILKRILDFRKDVGGRWNKSHNEVLHNQTLC